MHLQFLLRLPAILRLLKVPALHQPGQPLQRPKENPLHLLRQFFRPFEIHLIPPQFVPERHLENAPGKPVAAVRGEGANIGFHHKAPLRHVAVTILPLLLHKDRVPGGDRLDQPNVLQRIPRQLFRQVQPLPHHRASREGVIQFLQLERHHVLRPHQPRQNVHHGAFARAPVAEKEKEPVVIDPLARQAIAVHLLNQPPHLRIRQPLLQPLLPFRARRLRVVLPGDLHRRKHLRRVGQKLPRLHVQHAVAAIDERPVVIVKIIRVHRRHARHQPRNARNRIVRDEFQRPGQVHQPFRDLAFDPQLLLVLEPNPAPVRIVPAQGNPPPPLRPGIDHAIPLHHRLRARVGNQLRPPRPHHHAAQELPGIRRIVGPLQKRPREDIHAVFLRIDPIGNIPLRRTPRPFLPQVNRTQPRRSHLQFLQHILHVLLARLVVVPHHDNPLALQHLPVFLAPLPGAHGNGCGNQPQLRQVVRVLLSFDKKDRLRSVRPHHHRQAIKIGLDPLQTPNPPLPRFLIRPRRSPLGKALRLKPHRLVRQPPVWIVIVVKRHHLPRLLLGLLRLRCRRCLPRRVLRVAA